MMRSRVLVVGLCALAFSSVGEAAAFPAFAGATANGAGPRLRQRDKKSNSALAPATELSAPRIAVDLPPSPAFSGNAGDPDIVYSNGTYYAFTTGTALGNNLQALIDTSGSPTTGWQSYTGNSYGSTALPNPPGWQQPGTETSPGVALIGGRWVMWYDASLARTRLTRVSRAWPWPRLRR